MEIRRGDSYQASILMLDIVCNAVSTRRPIIIIWKILEAAQATFQLIIYRLKCTSVIKDL